MTRIAPASAYFILTFLALPLTFVMTARPAFAQEGAYYRVELAGPAPAAQIVEKGLLWSCSQQSCYAPESNSRDAIICSALARKLGPLHAFSAGGKAFDQQQLASCNRRAS